MILASYGNEMYETKVMIPHKPPKDRLTLKELFEMATENNRILPGDDAGLQGYATIQLANEYSDEDACLFAEQADV